MSKKNKMLRLCYSQLDGQPSTNHYADTSYKLKKQRVTLTNDPKQQQPQRKTASRYEAKKQNSLASATTSTHLSDDGRLASCAAVAVSRIALSKAVV